MIQREKRTVFAEQFISKFRRSVGGHTTSVAHQALFSLTVNVRASQAPNITFSHQNSI